MNPVDEHLQNARNLLENEKYPEAIQAYLEVLKSKPSDQQKGSIWAELSIVFYSMQEYERSIEAAQSMLAYEPPDEVKLNIFRTMGFCFAALNKLDEAAEHLEKSLALDKDSEKQQIAIYELLKVYFRQQKYSETERWITEVESYFYQNNKDYWLSLLFYKGFVSYYLNQRDDAEKIFEELLENAQDNPRKATALFGLAFISFGRKDYLKTINLCEAVTTHDPGFFDMETIGFMTSASFYHLGRKDVFEKYFLELKKNFPQGRYVEELNKLHLDENGKE